MGSICNEGGADEVQKVCNNGEEVNDIGETSSFRRVEEIMPPLALKDYEDLDLIFALEEPEDGTKYENAGIDIDTLFPDFSPEEEQYASEMNFHLDVEREILDPPPEVLPPTNPSVTSLKNKEAPRRSNRERKWPKNLDHYVVPTPIRISFLPRY